MKKKFNRGNRNQRFYILNNRIEVAEMRLLSERGEQLGIVSREVALNKAIEAGVDLVLIAPKAMPPVVKLIDFKKFLYQENKKLKEAKKGAKKSTIKDIKLSLFIGQMDFERLVGKGKKFLGEGHQLRIKLPLKGRELSKQGMAFALINKFIIELGEVTVSSPPKMLGRVLIAVVVPKK